MKRKGFTLVELLVVIAIIALLMGILMPALARVRQIAYRMTCGTNLSGIGKSMLLYANDYEEQYPIAGPRDGKWSRTGKISNWEGATLQEAFSDKSVTITSCFYLLIKYCDVMPKQFVCKGDVKTTAFKLSDYPHTDKDMILQNAWDFGLYNSLAAEGPGFHCSYSYHLPLPLMGSSRSFPISLSSSPSSPLCGDRNPYLDLNAAIYIDGGLGPPERPQSWHPQDGYKDPDKCGNAAPHQRDGQNILFNDTHVKFENYPNCGIDNDSVWGYWVNKTPSQKQKQLTLSPDNAPVSHATGNTEPEYSDQDAYLVNEVNL